MFYRREDDSSLLPLVFLAVALTLTAFSIFYSELNFAKITGLASGGSPTNPIEDPNPCIGGPCNVGSAAPPRQVLQEVSYNLDRIAQSASYVLDIRQIVQLNPDISESELFRYDSNLRNVLDNSVFLYKYSLDYKKKYSSPELDKYIKQMEGNIEVISEVVEEIETILPERVLERQEQQRQIAVWELNRQEVIEESTRELEEYIAEIEPVSDTGAFETTSGTAEIRDECDYPTSFSSFDEKLVDFGMRGVDYIKGDACFFESNVVYDASTGESNLRKFTVPQISIPSNPEEPLESSPFVALHFEEVESGNDVNTGVVIHRDENKLPNIVFFSSPDYDGVEKKMSKFIYDLFFKENAVSSLNSEITLDEADKFVGNQKKSFYNNLIVLWGILALMLVLFFFSNKLLAYEDFSRPVHKMGLNYHLSHSSRVERMIHDSLNELKKSPKVSRMRMPLIAKEYSKLSTKEKEKLAPIYERLVYGLRR